MVMPSSLAPCPSSSSSLMVNSLLNDMEENTLNESFASHSTQLSSPSVERVLCAITPSSVIFWSEGVSAVSSVREHAATPSTRTIAIVRKMIFFISVSFCRLEFEVFFLELPFLRVVGYLGYLESSFHDEGAPLDSWRFVGLFFHGVLCFK